VIFFGLVLLFLFSNIGPAHSHDPKIDWQSLETQHFVITFPAPYQNLAGKVANYLEEVAVTVDAFLQKQARNHGKTNRVQVVISDEVQSANGSASTIPYDVIHLNVSRPQPFSVLNDHDNWYRILAAHEYAHIIHLNTVGGIPAVINTLFGKLVAPNHLLPTWFIEGLATLVETKISSGGRVGNSMYNMYIRAMVLAGNFPSLDQITGRPHRWPKGALPYLLGSYFVNYILQNHGDDFFADFIYSYGRKVVPYSLNITAQEATGKSFIDLWKEFEAETKNQIFQQVQEIKAQVLTPIYPLTKQGMNNFHPRISSRHHLAYFSYDGHSHPQLRVIKNYDRQPTTTINHTMPEDRKGNKLLRLYSGSALTFSPDGGQIIFEDQRVHNHYYHLYDLYSYNLEKRQTRQITRGQRLRQPDFSPDGKKIAAIQEVEGKYSLMLMDVADGSLQTLIQGDQQTHLASPAFSPQGDKIALSLWKPGGMRDIYIYHLTQKSLTPLRVDRAIDLDPTWDKSGRYLIFSSDRSGVYNLHAFDLKKRQFFQITNLLEGAFMPEVTLDGKKILFTTYSEKGYDLAWLPLDSSNWRPDSTLPQKRQNQKISLGIPRSATTRSAPIHADKLPLAPRRYQPLDTIWPQAVLPFVSMYGRGDSINFLLSGADVLAKHQFEAELATGIQQNDLLYRINYFNRSFFPTLYLYSARDIVNARGLFERNYYPMPYLEERWSAAAGFRMDYLFSGYNYGFSLFYHLKRMRGLTKLRFHPLDIKPKIPQTGIKSGLYARWSISNLESYYFSFSYEKGFAANFGLGLNTPYLGGDFLTLESFGSLSMYQPLPYFPHHILAGKISAGLGMGGYRYRPLYNLGGLPSRDIIRDLMEEIWVGNHYLRGFPLNAFSGMSFLLLKGEYRFPLLELERGISTLPIYLGRTHLVLFLDGGNAFEHELSFHPLYIGTGFELRLELHLGYQIFTNVRLGYARGIYGPGIDNYYLVVGQGF